MRATSCIPRLDVTCVQVVLRMFKVQFEAGATVLEQGAVPKSTDCLYFLDQGEVDIVIAGSGEAANVAGEERKVGHLLRCRESKWLNSAG